VNLLVVIPCLNEEKTIASVIKGIPTSIPGIQRITTVIIDDGSTDGTAEAAKACGATVLNHAYNKGVGAAFQTAVDHFLLGGYDFMANLDADGQFNPLDIPKLLEPLLQGRADFVTASRFIDPSFKPNIPWVKHWGNLKIAGLVSRLAGQKFYDVSCGFRAYSRDTLMRLNLQGVFTYTQETFLELAFKGLRIQEVAVNVKYFADRKSRVAGSIPKYAINASLIIFKTYRDYFPLRFFWGISSVFFLFGLFFSGILMAHYFYNGQFTGQIWAGMVGGFFLMSALAFFIVGVFADMLDRQRSTLDKILYFQKNSLVKRQKEKE